MNTVTFAPHFSLTWAPQPDITVYELALCLPVVAMSGAYDVGSIKRWYEALSVEAKRHFEVTGDLVVVLAGNKSLQPDGQDHAMDAQALWDSLKSVASA